jgi:hypothetical protein
MPLRRDNKDQMIRPLVKNVRFILKHPFLT